MPRFRIGLPVALALSLVLHAGLLAPWVVKVQPITVQDLQVSFAAASVRERRPDHPAAAPLAQARKESADSIPATPTAEKKPASLAAPPPPSAEEWRLASTYTLRNSKRYRHNWGQQVRSLMGTAVEGPDQGLVRFRIEIAPDGKIAKVEELWATSEVAAKLAWQAIRSLPPLPPTPTGKPLVFEQTVSFLPYETGWPPSYKLDCLPEPQVFENPFAWDGAAPQRPAHELPARSHRPPPPDDCVFDSTAETIEQEEADMKRQMDQWRWGR
jgi:hypothetical protein